MRKMKDCRQSLDHDCYSCIRAASNIAIFNFDNKERAQNADDVAQLFCINLVEKGWDDIENCDALWGRVIQFARWRKMDENRSPLYRDRTQIPDQELSDYSISDEQDAKLFLHNIDRSLTERVLDNPVRLKKIRSFFTHSLRKSTFYLAVLLANQDSQIFTLFYDRFVASSNQLSEAHKKTILKTGKISDVHVASLKGLKPPTLSYHKKNALGILAEMIKEETISDYELRAFVLDELKSNE